MWTQKNKIKNVLDREKEIRSNFQNKALWRRLLNVMRPAKENQCPLLIWLRELLWAAIWEDLIFTHVTTPPPPTPPPSQPRNHGGASVQATDKTLFEKENT